MKLYDLTNSTVILEGHVKIFLVDDLLDGTPITEAEPVFDGYNVDTQTTLEPYEDYQIEYIYPATDAEGAFICIEIARGDDV